MIQYLIVPGLFLSRGFDKAQELIKHIIDTVRIDIKGIIKPLNYIVRNVLTFQILTVNVVLLNS